MDVKNVSNVSLSHKIEEDVHSTVFSGGGGVGLGVGK